MSKCAEKIEKLLKECFPTHRVKKEKYVVYANTQLKFDFYIPELKLLIEVQGEQHYTYSKFFHGNKSKFQAQKYRDSLKTQWAAEQKLNLLTLSEKEIESLTKDLFKNLIITKL